MTRILIVDDDEASLYIMQALLETCGYDVIPAQDGAEALEIARRDPPDIIVSDILMPEMDGFTLCREWQQDRVLKNIPFIFYTATYTSPDNEQFALSLGAERFIIKTTDPEVIIEIPQEVLAKQAGDYPDTSQKYTAESKTYLKGYSATLIEKLESKVEQLEAAYQKMEQEIAGRKQAQQQITHLSEQVASLQLFIKDASDNLQESLTTSKAGLYSLQKLIDSKDGQQYLEALEKQIAILEKLSEDMIRRSSQESGED